MRRKSLDKQEERFEKIILKDFEEDRPQQWKNIGLILSCSSMRRGQEETQDTLDLIREWTEDGTHFRTTKLEKLVTSSLANNRVPLKINREEQGTKTVYRALGRKLFNPNSRKCYRCGEEGHESKKCKVERLECELCGGRTHNRKACLSKFRICYDCGRNTEHRRDWCSGWWN